jgi:hypothetical protein
MIVMRTTYRVQPGQTGEAVLLLHEYVERFLPETTSARILTDVAGLGPIVVLEVTVPGDCNWKVQRPVEDTRDDGADFLARFSRVLRNGRTEAYAIAPRVY